MTGDDFLNFEEEEYSHLIEECEEAFNEGVLEKKMFTEEQFEFLINHFVNEVDDEMVYVLTTMGYKQHPYSSDLILRYADVLIVNRETDRASEILLSQIALEPSNSDLFFLMARLNIKTGNTGTALSYMDKALSISGEESYMDMLLTAAQDFIDSSDFENAILLLNKVEVKEPESRELLNDLAFCYERTGNFELSMRYYQRYLDKDPFNDNVWFNVGTIYARQFEVGKALDAYDYALALNPDNASVLFNKALLLTSSNQVDEGIDVFKEFLKFEPGNVLALSGMAEAYLLKGMTSEAEILFAEIIFYEPDNTDAMTSLANIYMNRRDFHSSRIYLREVIGKFDTDYERIRDNLIMCYKTTKDPEFLVFVIVSLYYLNHMELLYIYLGILVLSHEVWMDKLNEIVPELKNNKMIKRQLSKIKKKHY